MVADVQLKLIQLTRKAREVSLGELAHELHASLATLDSQAESLRSRGLATFREGTLILDTRQRVLLAEELIHAGRDPQKVGRFLEWQEFEDFSVLTLEQNGFRTLKHFVFKTRSGRREIDILAWNDTFLFAVDCKHWLRGLSTSRMSVAVRAQLERAEALAGKPELLSKFGVTHVERRQITPVIITLGDPRQVVVDRVPVVSVSKLMSFLYGISPVDERFRKLPVKNLGVSSLIVAEPKP